MKWGDGNIVYCYRYFNKNVHICSRVSFYMLENVLVYIFHSNLLFIAIHCYMGAIMGADNSILC